MKASPSHMGDFDMVSIASGRGGIGGQDGYAAVTDASGRQVAAQIFVPVNPDGTLSNAPKSVTVTPVILAADAYDAGDVIFDTTIITECARANGGSVLLQSMVGTDKSDQKVALTFVFLRTNVTLGTKDAAPSISDANSLKVCGIVQVAAADYVDLGGTAVFSKANIGLLMSCDAAADDLYVAAFTADGTPTYGTLGDAVFVFEFLQV